MSLITQCPNCATTFRVTPLDLQAHGGDVRCGRCAHIFNGYSMLATLRELEPARPAPPEAEQAARGVAIAAEMEQANDASEPALRQASGVESGSPLTQPADSSVAQTVRGRSTARGAASTSCAFVHTRRRGTVRQGAASRGTASRRSAKRRTGSGGRVRRELD